MNIVVMRFNRSQTKCQKSGAGIATLAHWKLSVHSGNTKFSETEFRAKYVPFIGPFFRRFEGSSLFFCGQLIV